MRGGKYCKGKTPEAWLSAIEKFQAIIDDLPDHGGKQLFELQKNLPDRIAQPEERTPLDHLRYMIIRLSEHWECYIDFIDDSGISWINNGKEQVMWHLKI